LDDRFAVASLPWRFQHDRCETVPQAQRARHSVPDQFTLVRGCKVTIQSYSALDRDVCAQLKFFKRVDEQPSGRTITGKTGEENVDAAASADIASIGNPVTLRLPASHICARREGPAALG
jgi:hypothetical protein